MKAVKLILIVSALDRYREHSGEQSGNSQGTFN
jgi:hypothetical protein